MMSSIAPRSYAKFDFPQVIFGALKDKFDRIKLCRSAMSMSKALTPTLCKAARLLLDWKQLDLSKSAGVAVRSVSRFEDSKGDESAAVREKLYHALNQAGIQFIASNTETGEVDGVGLRFRPKNPHLGIKVL